MADDNPIPWLLAHLDEDEQAAKNRGKLAGDVWTAVQVTAVRWEVVGVGRVIATNLVQWEAEHIARHDPAFTLREVDAKRRILDLHEPYQSEATGGKRCFLCGPGEYVWPCATVKALALSYDDRPGYQERWRP